MDKKDVLSFFQELRLIHAKSEGDWTNEVEKQFQDTKIKKLDIKRVYRYLDKNVKREAAKDDDLDEDDECEDEI